MKIERTKLTPGIVVLGAALLFAATARAHEEHCHKVGEGGRMVDVPEAKSRKACADRGGTWFHHHPHCHKIGDDGKLAEVPEAKTEKACKSLGGQWRDHGHEVLAMP